MTILVTRDGLVKLLEINALMFLYTNCSGLMVLYTNGRWTNGLVYDWQVVFAGVLDS